MFIFVKTFNKTLLVVCHIMKKLLLLTLATIFLTVTYGQKGNFYPDTIFETNSEYIDTDELNQIDSELIDSIFFDIKNFLEKHDTLNALNLFDSIIKLDPTNSLAYKHKALVFSEQNEYSKGIKTINKAIEIESKGSRQEFIELIYIRSFFYFNDENFNSSIMDLNYIEKMNAEIEDIFYIRGLAYYESGNKKLGCKDLKKAFELGLFDEMAIKEYKMMCK